MISRRYRDTDRINSIVTPRTNHSLISSSISREQQNKPFLRRRLSMSMCFCSANSQLPYRLNSALQAKRLLQWMKLKLLFSGGINTNSSWEHNNLSFSMKSHPAEINARMTAPPETTLINRGNSVAQASNAIKKATKPLISGHESGKSLRKTIPHTESNEQQPQRTQNKPALEKQNYNPKLVCLMVKIHTCPYIFFTFLSGWGIILFYTFHQKIGLRIFERKLSSFSIFDIYASFSHVG